MTLAVAVRQNNPMTDTTEGQYEQRPLNLPEYLMLLALDERRGKFLVDASTVGLGVAGAALADLARRGWITVDDEGVHAVDDPSQVLASEEEMPAGVPQGPLERPLGQVWQIIRDLDEVREPLNWINRFSRAELREAIASSLVDMGIVDHQEDKFLGLFQRDRLPERDGTVETDLRGRLGAVFVAAERTDGTTWPLTSLVHATRLTPHLFPDAGKETVRQAAHTPVGPDSWRDSVALILQATENAVAEGLIATTGGASGLD